MKKQWLSIVLVLCMVLCLAPTTARAEESKTCELKITVEVNGLPTSVNAAGTTFTFQIKKAINAVTPQYYVYDTTTVNVGADGKGTRTVSVAPGKYIVKQTECSQQIGAYIWQKVTYTPSGNNESITTITITTAIAAPLPPFRSFPPSSHWCCACSCWCVCGSSSGRPTSPAGRPSSPSTTCM